MSLLYNCQAARPAFKAYDIRGRIPQEINGITAFRIGAAFAKVLKPRKVAVGYDIRLSSPELATQLFSALALYGVDVINLGMCGTEEIYYAVGSLGLDGGIMVTASHNPADYNGFKMVVSGSRPLTQEGGLRAIRELVCSETNLEIVPNDNKHGDIENFDIHSPFCQFLLNKIDNKAVREAHLRVVADAGNGGAGLVLRRLRKQLPIDLIIENGNPDGTFPNGIPNPLLPENRNRTSQAVLKHHATFGAAWDGDFDRCFFFDENGRFIEGYYLVSLMAQHFLNMNPGSAIIHDPRLTWNTRETVSALGGVAIESKTGHAFIKENMRLYKAIYGGEMSAHHYFEDFFFCDSGMIPFMLMLNIISQCGHPLSQLVNSMMEHYPVSGEINRTIDEPAEKVLTRIEKGIEAEYGSPLSKGLIDGLSLEYRQFRFNVRSSNTEPLLRLNVETRANTELLKKVTEQILALIA